ncbi:MAG: DEAD/DEAH box helicase family protein [Elusimicrobiota bacterium]|jgi:type III restriction enzyme|nr:DEAD/DEAH box helicase family protein [Elusimicrobiota bacterium]
MPILQEDLKNYFGVKNIPDKEIPEYIASNLNPRFILRPYQKEAFQYFLHYEDEHPHKLNMTNLLFHMATGSGKTLIMAGLILYFYKKGYRDFLFFVNAANIVEKTKDNFINSSSAKYLFSQKIVFDNREVKIKSVENFEAGNSGGINIHFTTIQGLHSKLHNTSENSPSFSDFKDRKIVLLADESHHINVETKQRPTAKEQEVKKNWERTVYRIFESNVNNVLLEFSATMALDNAAIKEKYNNKIIFNYALKEFCRDKYSKDIYLLRADLAPLKRALQAAVLSQYRKKIAYKNAIPLKPVILMKSENINDAVNNHSGFIELIKNLKVSDIDEIRNGGQIISGDDSDNAVNIIQEAFRYFRQNKITDGNLIRELQQDFSEERCVCIHSKAESEEKQVLINNLEDRSNEIRVIFNVAQLTEGWDVLNLFDIVRLYESRDGGHGKIGKGTISEAQLIGRGARYCPFAYKDSQGDKRKFDGEINNELRVIETLHYHSPDNHRYISELKAALIQSGLWDEKAKSVNVKLKDSFIDDEIYNNHYLFFNEKQKKWTENDLKKIVFENSKSFEYKFRSGNISENSLFNEQSIAESASGKAGWIKFSDFPKSVFRTALSMIDFYKFSNIKQYLPISSIDEFIEWLKDYEVMTQNIAPLLAPKNKLELALFVLNELKKILSNSRQEWIGTKIFKPFSIKQKISAQKTLKFILSESDKEFGKSTKDSADFRFMSLYKQDWYVYDECYGTSEEKHFIKYIYSVKDELLEKYKKFYLIRNERDFKIYDFEEGKALEPDFVLFLQEKNSKDKVYYQLFIEPKGSHLLETDRWKETFLRKIKDDGKIDLILQNAKFNLYGMPFYNENKKQVFIDEFKKIVLP